MCMGTDTPDPPPPPAAPPPPPKENPVQFEKPKTAVEQKNNNQSRNKLRIDRSLNAQGKAGATGIRIGDK